MICLVSSVQVDHSGIVPGHLQNGHLMNDFSTAVTTSPPLPQELGGENFSRGLLHTPLDNCKLAPRRDKERQRLSFIMLIQCFKHEMEPSLAVITYYYV